ncbi:uncharacterized protein [Rutidosis leptorrhynchoides]|uniref:uncharacterized protein n=1 Tax=Rutidosis leptorrhynchoides TaxID=125765 RepID=UPI003A994DD9
MKTRNGTEITDGGPSHVEEDEMTTKIEAALENYVSVFSRKVKQILKESVSEHVVDLIREQMADVLREEVERRFPRPQHGVEMVFSYKNFMATKPPHFHGDPDPMKSMAWISDVEVCFHTSECQPEKKTRLATSLMRGNAKDWLDGKLAMYNYKKYWDVIKDELIVAIKWFWEKGEFSRGCNASFVTLVPKRCNPTELGDFRPISLISSYYKIIAKILSNRLKTIIPRIIGVEQRAFVKGRYILDGALIVNESVEFLKVDRRRGFLFKVDFEKAFDCLNWNFLIDVMKCMGFGTRWRKWIFSCLSSTSISIFVNGSPTSEFQPSRGVRQGDPLSPFLFIIASEGLNILAKATLEKGLFKGVEVRNDKVLISHLQYADDTIFMGEWSRANVYNLHNLLKCFELALLGKWRCGVNSDETNSIANILGCQVVCFPFTYLGLCIGSRMKKIKDWEPVVEKIKSRLSIWKMRTMSFGGRLTLIKSVLSSLPLNGGLNIGSLKSKNLALLGKWWWRFYTETNSLWAKVVRSVYGPSGGLDLDANSIRSLNPTTWNDILLTGCELEEKGICFRKSFKKTVGNGQSTTFWDERWIGQDKLKNIFPRLYRLEKNNSVKVADRIDFVADVPKGCWDWSRAPSGRTEGELQNLASLIAGYKFDRNKKDSWGWSLAHNGIFTVKELASLAEDSTLTVNNNVQETIRNNLVPKK